MVHHDADKPKLWVPPHYSTDSPAGSPPPGHPHASDAPDASAPPDDGTQEAGNELAEQLAAQTERAANLEKDLLLLRAEFENFRKRLQRSTEERVRFAAQPLIGDLLRVMDDLNRALAAAADSPDAPMRDGVQMVRDHFLQVLQSHGVEEIPAHGQPFDPHLHDAVHVVATDDVPHDTVLEVASSGFTLHDRVIRAAKVVVSRHSDPGTKVPVSPQAAPGENTEPEAAPPAGEE